MATFAGVTTVTALVVQFTKGLLKKQFDDYVVRIYAFVVALILNFIFASAGSGIQGATLTVLNSVLVTLTAMGGATKLLLTHSLKRNKALK